MTTTLINFQNTDSFNRVRYFWIIILKNDYFIATFGYKSYFRILKTDIMHCISYKLVLIFDMVKSFGLGSKRKFEQTLNVTWKHIIVTVTKRCYGNVLLIKKNVHSAFVETMKDYDHQKFDKIGESNSVTM